MEASSLNHIIKKKLCLKLGCVLNIMTTASVLMLNGVLKVLRLHSEEGECNCVPFREMKV